jgi:hypothetical protein
VMIHHHIRRHLDTLGRQYTAASFALPEATNLGERLSRAAESYGNMAAKLQSLRGIVYVSAPPLLGGLLSRVDWTGIFSAAPWWLLSLSYFYVFYVAVFCFDQKRQILLGHADWLSPRLMKQIYELEDRAYHSIGIEKKRELPLDLLLIAGNGALLVGLVLWPLARERTGPGGGIVATLGGGRFSDSIIPLTGGLIMLWTSAQRWKSRRVALSA